MSKRICPYTKDTDTTKVFVTNNKIENISVKMFQARGFECCICNTKYLKNATVWAAYQPDLSQRVCQPCILHPHRKIAYCHTCQSAFPVTDASNKPGKCPECYEKTLNAPAEWLPDLVKKHSVDIVRHYGIDVNAFGSKPYIGIELELELNCSTRTEFGQIVESIYEIQDNRIILKQDSSLECGVELVTIPDDYRNHLKYFQLLYRQYKSFGGVVGNSSGLHIHLNKKALSKLRLSKLNIFINDRANLDFMLAIAGRFNDMYASFIPCSNWSEASHVTDKYRALNIRKHTVEFRMFKAPKTFEEFASRVEFVMAAYFFTRDASAKELTHTNFVQWVLSSGRFQYLFDYMSRRHLC